MYLMSRVLSEILLGSSMIEHAFDKGRPQGLFPRRISHSEYLCPPASTTHSAMASDRHDLENSSSGSISAIEKSYSGDIG